MKELLGKTSRVQVLETFSVFAAVSLLLAISSCRQVFALLAFALLLVALFIKPLEAVITRWWLKFSELLSGINNRVILTLIFYLILTPLALLYRLFNKDLLNLDGRRLLSFYVDRNYTYSKPDLEKMW
ncbi:MAG: hypothetical protein HXX17_10510 [Geobacteraceae bacterium]|nr:hypothetical protein [Geobacteraceae bacterium]